jgi:hypothetical protein
MMVKAFNDIPPQRFRDSDANSTTPTTLETEHCWHTEREVAVQ